MQTIVLAGGLGTRLGDLGTETGKAMVEIAGRPFLELLLRQLAGRGLTDFILCVGYRASRIRGWLGDGERLGVRVRYSLEHEPLGTAGALANAGNLIEGDTFMLTNGDSMVDFDVAALLGTHERTGATVTMTLAQTADVTRFGRITLDADGAVGTFVEKPDHAGPGLVNAGVYACRRRVLDALPQERPASFERTVLPRLVGDGLYGFIAPGPLVDIGTPDSLDAARRDPAFLLRLADLTDVGRC